MHIKVFYGFTLKSAYEVMICYRCICIKHSNLYKSFKEKVVYDTITVSILITYRVRSVHGIGFRILRN